VVVVPRARQLAQGKALQFPQLGPLLSAQGHLPLLGCPVHLIRNGLWSLPRFCHCYGQRPGFAVGHRPRPSLQLIAQLL
jgi:hypothetical protein